MKRIILVFTCLALFTSCGIFKKSSRNTLRDQSEIQTQVAKVIEKKDQSIVVTSEKIDTAILIPEKRISKEAIGTREPDGSFSALFDTAGLQAMIKYNQATGKFNFDLYQPAELKQIYLDRTVTENRDITEAITKDTKTTEKKDVKQKVKITEPADPVITIFRVLGAAFIILFIILAYRRIKRG